MRYQNWDVLLFPADSRVPLQEFDTKCFALNPGSRLAPQHVPSASEIENFESMTIIPTVTSFITSLEPRTPFRISIHSWKKPTASGILQSYKTRDERVMFEARIYIDGVLQAQHSFDDNSAWPEVIEEETRTGDGQPLLFPVFHKDILYQTHWEPGDVIGRISVVIAEGVVRLDSPQPDPRLTFDRLRDVVTFAFQHASQDVLEYSSIAWPNPRMFGRLAKPAVRPGVIGSRLSLTVADHDMHSHSPNRIPISGRATKQASNGYDNFQRLLNAETFSDLQSDPPGKMNETPTGGLDSYKRSAVVDLTGDAEDPFVGPQSIASRAWRAQLRSSSHDISMPDYTSSRREFSRTHTSMSGVNYQRADFLKHMEEANPREIVQALSPAQQAQLMKELKAVDTPAQGTHAPSNTPRSLSGLKQATLAIDKIRDSLGKKVGSNANSPWPINDLSCHSKKSGNEAEMRTCATSSANGQTETVLIARNTEHQLAVSGGSVHRLQSSTTKRKWISNSAVTDKTDEEGNEEEEVERSSPSKSGSHGTAICEIATVSGRVAIDTN
ncbi:hypothetical protein LTR84_005249 [Exophiala bonariae]|uniref:Uncharacterized protein n=1 Tax=Exophiala bonariae TaxID=1690606 RepID=A0AAV9NPW9_9EURO|nr:hypothetical protein LTR84_005249 [Exophiala bonariae]